VAGLLLFGLESKTAALLIALAATAGFLVAASRLLKAMSGNLASSLFLVPLAVAPMLAVTTTSGMETMLFVFLQASVFLAYVDRQPWRLGLYAALLLLARIDGALVIAAIIITEASLGILRRSKREVAMIDGGPATHWRLPDMMRIAGFASALLTPWIVFTTWYYGNPIPISVMAKRVLYGEAGMDRTPLSKLAEGVFALGYFIPWQLGACIVVGGLMFLAARIDRFSSIAVWFAVYLAFLILGQTHIHPWYLTPFHAFALLALCLFASRLLNPLPHWMRNGIARPTVVGAGWFFLSLVCAWGFFAGSNYAAIMQGRHEDAHVAVARFLDQATSSDDVIYAPDIGYIGAITGRRILDAAGIVSPEVIPFNKGRNFAGVLKASRPAWAVIGLYGNWQEQLLSDSWVRQNYQPVYANNPERPVDWPSAHELLILRYDWDYLVLQLKQPAD